MFRRQDVLQQGRLSRAQVACEEGYRDDPIYVGPAYQNCVNETRHESYLCVGMCKGSQGSLRSGRFGLGEDEIGWGVI